MSHTQEYYDEVELQQGYEIYCPVCSYIMRLAYIHPESRGHDRRHYECSSCAYEENRVVKFR